MDIQRESTGKNRRPLYIGAALAGGTLITALLVMLEPAAPKVDRNSILIGTVTRGSFTREVRGPGTLVPEQVVYVTALTGGRVEQVWAQPGQTVADSHFDKFELPAAESAFRAVAESPGDPKEARAFLALIAWRYRHDWGTAESELRAALHTGVDSSKVFSWVSRMERRRGRHRQAVAAARQGLRTSSSTAEELKAAQMLGEAAVASVETALWADPPRSLDSLSADWLREAHTHLTRLLPQNRGLLNLSRVALRVALLAGDGDAALDAWRSYYATLLDTREGRLLEEPGRVLAKQLPAWGTGPLSADVRASVAKAFADAAMFEEAAMTAWGFG